MDRIIVLAFIFGVMFLSGWLAAGIDWPFGAQVLAAIAIFIALWSAIGLIFKLVFAIATRG